MEYTISLEASTSPDDLKAIDDGLLAYNLQFVLDPQFKRLSVFIRDVEGAVLGGLIGSTCWGWLHVSLLWLDESIRQRGLGRQILTMAEEEAIRRGCHHAHLNTLDFQAPGFYEKQGYTIWGVLDDHPNGHQRTFYQKKLSASHD